MNYKAPLTIFVAWHPKFSEGRQYADLIYASFSRPKEQPLVRITGIQVMYLNSPLTETMLLSIFASGSVAFVLLVEENMVDDETWTPMFTMIDAYSAARTGNMIIPVLVSENRYPNPEGIDQAIQQIRLDRPEEKIKIDYLIIHIAHALCMFLNDEIDLTGNAPARTPEKVKFFLSHAKKDGKEFVEKLNAAIKGPLDLETFYDAQSISSGFAFDKQIEESIGTSALLVVQTDVYSSRTWCRKEILSAKRNSCPIVVFNGFEIGEKRGFPYMANVPCVRLSEKLDKENYYITTFSGIIRYTLIEILRFKYQKQYLLSLNQRYDCKIGPEAIFSSPPELVTLLPFDHSAKTDILYPDPILGDEEYRLFRELNSNLNFYTPQQLPILKLKADNNTYPLQGKIIGVSISNPEFNVLYSQEHLVDAMVDIARFLLAAGARLAYGGSLHNMDGINYTELFFELVEMYNTENLTPADKVLNYTVFPYSEAVDVKKRASLSTVAKIKEVSTPSEITIDKTEWQQYIKSNDPQKRIVTATLLTLMRREMNSAISARIFIGGKIIGTDGAYPGIMEEAMLALKDKRPIYLIGAYGGCTGMLTTFLQSDDPLPDFVEKYIDKTQPSHSGIVRDIEQFIQKYQEEISFFRNTGLGGLNNGLNDEENQRVFTSTNLSEIIQLIIQGLLKTLK